MNPITEILKSIRRSTRPVLQQLELPLAGTRLGKEEAQTILALTRIRRRLAAM